MEFSSGEIKPMVLPRGKKVTKQVCFNTNTPDLADLWQPAQKELNFVSDSRIIKTALKEMLEYRELKRLAVQCGFNEPLVYFKALANKTEAKK